MQVNLRKSWWSQNVGLTSTISPKNESQSVSAAKCILLLRCCLSDGGNRKKTRRAPALHKLAPLCCGDCLSCLRVSVLVPLPVFLPASLPRVPACFPFFYPFLPSLLPSSLLLSLHHSLSSLLSPSVYSITGLFSIFLLPFPLFHFVFVTVFSAIPVSFILFLPFYLSLVLHVSLPSYFSHSLSLCHHSSLLHSFPPPSILPLFFPPYPPITSSSFPPSLPLFASSVQDITVNPSPQESQAPPRHGINIYHSHGIVRFSRRAICEQYLMYAVLRCFAAIHVAYNVRFV